MKLRSFLNSERRAVGFSRLKKAFRRKCVNSAIPLMLFGAQRSGTSLLMDVLQLHRDTQVFTEVSNSAIYSDFRLRGVEVVSKAIRDASAPVVCLKPISDSHIARNYIDSFPNGKYAWIVRNYLDVAASSIKKWPSGSRAVRIVCAGGVGGGWFQEGVSAKTGAIMRSLDQGALTEFDYACLVWWARNRLYCEQELAKLKNVVVISYERLLDGDLERFFHFAGLSFDQKYARYIKRPTPRTSHPPVSPIVAELCVELQNELEQFR